MDGSDRPNETGSDAQQASGAGKVRRSPGRPRKTPVSEADSVATGRKASARETAARSTNARKASTRKSAGLNGKGGTAAAGKNARGRAGLVAKSSGKGNLRARANGIDLADSISYGEGSGRGSAKLTRKRILAAARLLFARYGMEGVSVRAIAEKAGVNHALVHRYFGNKLSMITEIVQNEVTDFGRMTLPQPTDDFESDLARIRDLLRHVIVNMKDTLMLILRAEMDGLNPSLMLRALTPRAPRSLTDWITAQQAAAREAARPCCPLPDPQAMAMIISGALFTVVAAGPWLASAVGLRPDADDEQRERLLDTVMLLLAQAAGRPMGA